MNEHSPSTGSNHGAGSTGRTGDDDRRLHNYFEQQAGRVTLPDGDAGRIVARVARRRRTRRSLTGGAATVVVLLAAVGVYAGRTEQEVVVGAPGSTQATSAPPVFTWTDVEVPTGLGWSTGDVVSSDGTFYSLSTAPGRTQPDANGNIESALYRSSDGRTWTEATLPAGVRPSQIASSPGHLYAVGTAPAGGGGVDLLVATSTNGASSWTQARIPAPAAAIKARFPTEVQVGPAQLAVGPAGLTALVSVTAFPSPERLLGARNIPEPAGAAATKDGVDVYAVNEECAKARGVAVPTTVAPDAPPPSTTSSPDPAAQKLEVEQALAAKQAAGGTIPTPGGGTIPVPDACLKQQPEVAAHYTWEQLGLEPELAPLVKGQTYAYSSTDGQAFTEVTPSPLAGITGAVVTLVGSTDGYRSFASDPFTSTLTERFSPDGRTWTATGSIDGWVQSSGHLGGQPAVVVNRQTGNSLLVAAPGGGWSNFDIDAAVAGGTGRTLSLGPVALGPLGFVAVAFGQDSDNRTISLVESVDGHTFSTRSLADLGLDPRLEPLGVTMNADAVVVRLSLPNGGPDGSTAPLLPQHLLVGTRG